MRVFKGLTVMGYKVFSVVLVGVFMLFGDATSAAMAKSGHNLTIANTH